MTGFITVDAAGENRISIAPGALDRLTPVDLERFRPTIREADLVVVSLEVPVAVALRALAIAAEEGTRTVLNPAPANAGVDWSGVSIVTPNLTEAITLLGADASDSNDFEALAGRLAKRFGCSVVLTLGALGSVVHDGATFARVDPLLVEKVVDSTGAGDAHTAALAVALAEGLPLERAAQFAAAAGALAVTVREVVPALPYRDVVDDLVARTPRRPS
jgi:ribokinase